MLTDNTFPDEAGNIDEIIAEDLSSSPKLSSGSGFESGTIAAYLLRGVIYREQTPALWNSLIDQQHKVLDLVLKLGVKLVVDENEGYAYLRSLTAEEMPELKQLPPRLMVRRQISFNVSFLLLLLRHRLVEFDSEASGDTRLVLSETTLTEMIKTYLKERTNEAKLQNQLETIINKVVELGFLKPLQDRKSKGEKNYEVMRILKAYFDAQMISDFSKKINEYQLHLISQESELDKED